MRVGNAMQAAEAEAQLPACVGGEDTTTNNNETVVVHKIRTDGGWKAAILILGAELCEKLAVSGIALNLITYLHSIMHISTSKSANIITNFYGTSYLCCLLGGFIADTYFGRYKTIIISSCIQLMGIVLITCSSSIRFMRPPPCTSTNTNTNTVLGGESCDGPRANQMAALYISLYLMAFGTGGIKSSISGLGADQFDEKQPEEKVQMVSFFNWFTFWISTATLLAVTVLIYLQDNVGRSFGYCLSVGCMVVSLLIFFASKTTFRQVKPTGSPLSALLQVFVAAWRNRKHRFPSQIADICNIDGTKMDLEKNDAKNGQSPPYRTNQFRFLDKATVRRNTRDGAGVVSSFETITTRQVEEAKSIIRLLPIAATNVVFWTVAAQMTTFTIEQAMLLNRLMLPSSLSNFKIPPASVAVFMQIGILASIPIYEKVIEPWARKWRKKGGINEGVTSLERIGIGLAISILGMVASALVERRRLWVAASGGIPMSVFFLTPQLLLVGIAHTFTYAGQLDFFYRESPLSMRSLSTGLCFSNVSLGFFTSSWLVSTINHVTTTQGTPGWLANNLNHGRLDYFYWFLAVLDSISFIAYIICAYWYKKSSSPMDS